MMTPPPRSRFYLRGTVIFQARRCGDGQWLPRCTVVYGLEGRRTDHVIADDVPCESEEAADAVIFDRAKAWIDANNDKMSSYSWVMKVDGESSDMWRELHQSPPTPHPGDG